MVNCALLYCKLIVKQEAPCSVGHLRPQFPARLGGSRSYLLAETLKVKLFSRDTESEVIHYVVKVASMA